VPTAGKLEALSLSILRRKPYLTVSHFHGIIFEDKATGDHQGYAMAVE
jgi:hypothetical protein